MKIQCQSCQAKYTIADEKVLGKVVKIRCKKCSATIVINGNEQRAAEDNADTHVFDYASQSNEQWTVNVADGDQRTMTIQEIVAEYKAGAVNDETYCWKDGMADWLPLREIDPIYGAIKLGPRPSLADDHSLPPTSSPAAALFSSSEVDQAVDSPFAGGHANGNGNLFAADAAAPAAARRGGGRGQGADLFSGAATAGGEDDVMTSAAGSMGGGGAAMESATQDSKLTGQRNENSVLFSLSALTEGAKPAAENRTTATSDGSGLIDIRALSQAMTGPDEKKDKGSRVDDIMNLSGGGAFGAALAAPILAPPPLEATDLGGGGAAESKQNKTLLIAILGGAALIAIGIVVAVVLTRSPAPDPTKDPTAGTTTTAPTGAASLAMNDPGTAGTADPVTTPPTPTADNTPPPPGTGNSTSTSPSRPSGGTKPSGGGAKESKPAAAEPAPAPPPKPEGPKDFGSALAAAAGKPANEPAKPAGGGGSTAPFDRGAAAAALGGVNVQSCKKPDGPTGAGHVKVTFAPNGTVSAAVIDGGPFPGTSVGGCIAGKYRGARVPPFAGGPVSVGKSFTVN